MINQGASALLWCYQPTVLHWIHAAASPVDAAQAQLAATFIVLNAKTLPLPFLSTYCPYTLQANNLLPFQACLLPLMRLLADPRIQNSPSKHFTNTIYSAVFHDLDHGRCAAMIRQLLTTLQKTPPASSSATTSTSSQDTSSASGSSSGGFDAAAAVAMGGAAAKWAGVNGCWATRGWLDVLEPFVWYLLEVLRRFRQDGSWQQHKEGEECFQLVLFSTHWCLHCRFGGQVLGGSCAVAIALQTAPGIGQQSSGGSRQAMS
jgi:hypothetical protein